MAILAAGNFLQCLSVETASSFCAFFWRLIAPRTRRHRRVKEHLRLAFPHLTESEIDALSLKVWDNLGRVMAETVHLRELAPSAFEADRDFSSVADIVRDAKGGIVLASGHIGAYELIVMAGHVFSREPTGVYQELSNPLVDDYLSWLRMPMFPGGLFPKSHTTARKVLNIVRAGGTAAFLADHRELKGIEIAFFGRPAYCNPFPSMLARYCRVPFIGGRVIRRLGGRFTFEAAEIFVPKTQDRSADIRTGTENFHALLESYIREYPEQWMWTHRKWAQPAAGAGNDADSASGPGAEAGAAA